MKRKMMMVALFMMLLTQSVVAKGFTNSIGMKFVPIPAGSFMMGDKATKCPKDDPFTDKNEFKECYKKVNKTKLPRHNVTLKSFYMGTTEVTQMQWYKVMGTNPAYFKKENLGYDSRNNPIENISLKDAKQFVKKLNKLEKSTKYALPSETQWTYVYKQGLNTKKFRDNINRYAWYKRNSNDKTHPVAKKRANRWGVYDMHGNVTEFLEDCWHNSFVNAPNNEKVWKNNCTKRNPMFVLSDFYKTKSQILNIERGVSGYSNDKSKYTGLRVVYNKPSNSRKQSKKVDTTFANSKDMKNINKKDVNVKTNTQDKDFYNSLNGSSNKPVDME